MELTYKVDWKPLEILARTYQNKINLDEWMYMGTVDNFGTDIYLYKNIITRNYLNADYYGDCYRYDSLTKQLGNGSITSEYVPIHKEVAVNKAINYK
tara:strand:+ start:637 stop:927 length:291 start_codon:yes stop_codon:yes gene_type:complete